MSAANLRDGETKAPLNDIDKNAYEFSFESLFLNVTMT